MTFKTTCRTRHRETSNMSFLLSSSFTSQANTSCDLAGSARCMALRLHHFLFGNKPLFPLSCAYFKLPLHYKMKASTQFIKRQPQLLCFVFFFSSLVDETSQIVLQISSYVITHHQGCSRRWTQVCGVPPLLGTYFVRRLFFHFLNIGDHL